MTEICLSALLSQILQNLPASSNFFCHGYGNFKGMGNLSHSYTWDLCQLMKYFGELQVYWS